MSKEIKDLHKNGWDEKNDTYTEWGFLVLGYYNTLKFKRNENFRILLEQDIKDKYVRMHIDAIKKATDMELNPKKYGAYGSLFLKKTDVLYLDTIE